MIELNEIQKKYIYDNQNLITTKNYEDFFYLLRTIGSSNNEYDENLEKISQFLYFDCNIDFLDSNLTLIRPCQFKNSDLDFIKIPFNIDKISVSAFENSNKLRDVEFSASLNFIYRNAFKDCDLEVIDLSRCKNLQAIGEQAFANNKNLKKIILPEHRISINRTTFDGCNSIQYIKSTRLSVIPLKSLLKTFQKNDDKLRIKLDLIDDRKK